MLILKQSTVHGTNMHGICVCMYVYHLVTYSHICIDGCVNSVCSYNIHCTAHVNDMVIIVQLAMSGTEHSGQSSSHYSDVAHKSAELTTSCSEGTYVHMYTNTYNVHIRILCV